MNKILDLTCLDAEYTRRLNDIAEKCKKEYTEFVDKYSKKYGHFYLWWAIPFSSRNIYLDDTFQNICYLHLCRQIILGNSEVNHIIVNSKALYDVLLLNYEQELLKKKIVLENHEKSLKLFGTFRGMFWQFIAQIKSFLRVKIYLGRQRYDIEDSISLIDTPLLSSCFQHGSYKDRYFNNIQHYTEKKIYFIPSLMKNSSIGWKEFVNNVRESQNYKCILKESFINIFDYLYVIEYFVYCLMLSVRKYEYGEINVTPLVRESMLKGSFCAPSIKGVLNDRFIKHLKKTTIKVENLISWYEGRPSEIMLQRAFRKYYPDSDCVGYIGFPHSEFALSQYISEEQYQHKSAPLKMTVPGMIYEKQAKQFCEKVKLIKVPILRCVYECREDRIDQHLPNKKKNLLVILPYFEGLAGDMLHILNEYMESRIQYFDITIKNHPVHVGKTADFYLKENLHFVPRYVEGELHECLRNIDIAYISYSTASLEVISQGVFLVNLCPVGKLRDTGIPEDIDDKLYRIVYDDKDVFETFDDFLQGDNATLNVLNVSDLLEPINRETINRMWD